MTMDYPSTPFGFRSRTLLGGTVMATAVVAAVGGCGGGGGGGGADTRSSPADARLTVNPDGRRHDDAVTPEVLRQRLDEPVGHEVRLITVEYPPGGTTAPHRHPGAIFGYVLSGHVTVGLDAGPPVTYGPGQAWYERPGQLHAISRNASTTEPAKFLVVFIAEPGQPQLRFVNENPAPTTLGAAR